MNRTFETVACDGCGVIFDPNAASLAFNNGNGEGPKYFCIKCEPPAKSVGEAIKTIDNFMLEHEGSDERNSTDG